jgi:hypothetical protein
VKIMAKRIQLSTGASEPYQHLLGLHKMVEKSAADAGLDQRGVPQIHPKSTYRPMVLM